MLKACECNRIEEQAGAYADGALSAAEADAIEAHLETCQTCRAAIERFLAMDVQMKIANNRPAVAGPGAIARQRAGSFSSIQETLTPTVVAVRKPAAAGNTGGTRPKPPPAHGGAPRQVLGPYEILEELGRGGMGVVMKARDPALKREVALKLMRKEAYERDTWRMRFVEEAQITGQLEHPGIAPVYFLGKNSKGYEFFSMKLVAGRTLAQLLELRATDAAIQREFALPRLLSIFERVCETVEFAHSRGVLHRDIKPANIMIGAHGEVWVLDWGLAKVLATQANPDDSRPLGAQAVNSIREEAGALTASGSVIGTPSYMAPEQAHGESLDERGDLYSLGAVLFEILTGELPVGGKQAAEILLRVANGKIRRVNTTGAGRRAPKALAAIAGKCLAFRRKHRYGATADLLKDLRAYAAGEAVSVLPESAWERLARYLSRHRKTAALWAGIGAAACLLVTIGALWIASEQGKARVAEAAKYAAEQAAAERERVAAAAESKAHEAEKNSVQQQLRVERERAARAQRRVDAFEPYARAMDLLTRGQRLDEAEKLSRAALAIDGDFPEAQFALAEAQRAQGKSKDAADAFMQADALSVKVAGRSSAKALLSAAFAFDNAWYAAEADAAFKRVAELAGDDPLADVGRIFRLIHLSQYADANALMARLLQRAPHLWEAHYAHASLLIEERSAGCVDPGHATLDQIETALLRGLQLSPRQAVLHELRSVVKLYANQDPSALSELDQAIELEPLNATFRFARADYRGEFKDEKGSRDDLQAAKRLQVAPIVLKLRDFKERCQTHDMDEQSFCLQMDIARDLNDRPTELASAVFLGLELGREQEVSGFAEKLKSNFQIILK